MERSRGVIQESTVEAFSCFVLSARRYHGLADPVVLTVLIDAMLLSVVIHVHLVINNKLEGEEDCQRRLPMRGPGRLISTTCHACHVTRQG